MIKLNDILNEAGGVVNARIQQKPKGYWAVFNKRGQSQFEGDKKFMINILKKASTLSPNAIGSLLDRARPGGKHLEFKAQFSRYYFNESVNESDLGLTLKKGKTITVTHKTSGKELVIIDKPNVRKEYEKIGFFAESINEGFNFRKIRSELEYEYDWDYVEQEGGDSVRFDFGRDSMWVNKDGSISGNVPKDSGLKRSMKKLGIKESVNEVLTRGGAIELQGQAKYLAQGIKDMTKAYKKKDWAQMEEEVDYIVTKAKLMGDIVKQKRYQESVNEAGTKSIDGEELLKYLQKRFKMSRKQAIASMKKHNMDVSFLKESGLQYRMGVKRYGKEGMTKIQSAAGSGAGHAEIGKIKDKYDKKKKRKKESVEEKLEKYDGGYTHEWNEQRKKNAEVLGYELAGTEDIREEVEPKGNMAKIFKIVKDKQHAKIGGMLVDTFSASALVKIFDAVKDSNKEKLNKMSMAKLAYVLDKAFKSKVVV